MSRHRGPPGGGRLLRCAAVCLAAAAELAAPCAGAQTTGTPTAGAQIDGVTTAEPPIAPDPLNPFSAAAGAAAPAPYGLPVQPTAPVAGAGPAFIARPYIGLQEQFTDNAFLTQNDRQSDVVTRGLAGLAAQFNLGRLQGGFSGQAGYDWYARESGLDGKLLSGSTNMTYSLLRDRLWIEASGVVTNGYTTTFGQPAISRSGVNGSTELGSYEVGPRLATTLGGAADLALAASFGQVFFSSNGGTGPTPLVLPPNDNIYQVEGRLDTGRRLGRLELLTTAQLEQDDHGYHTANAVQSAYVALTPRVRLLARAGYERIYDSGSVDITAPLLSAGFEFRPNPDSVITLEGGERYKHTAWAAQAHVVLTPTLVLQGAYSEAIEPDQLFVSGSIADLVARVASLPGQLVPTTFTAQQNLYNQPSFAKTGDLSLSWRGLRDVLTFAADWSNRRFFNLAGADRTLTGYVDYSHRLRPDLTFSASLRYAHTFASPLYGANESFAASADLAYQLNSSSDLRVSYAHTDGRQFTPSLVSYGENVVLLAIQKRF